MPLPPGLSLNRSTGVISGTPTEVGTFTTTLRVRDAQNQSRDIPISIAVQPYTAPSLTGDYPIYATRTLAYSGAITRTGGTAPFTWSIASGTLPTGLTINAATGAITGTPTDTNYTDRTITVRVVDNAGSIVQKGLGLKYANVLSYPSSYATGYSGVAYNSTPATTGGHLPRVFALTSGTLPPGLTLETSTGRLYGTPSSVGTYPVTITCTDAAGSVATVSPSLSVAPAYVAIDVTGAITGASASIEKATGSHTFTPNYGGVSVTGGSGTYSYSWARQSGSTAITPAAPTAFASGFTGTIAPGASASSVYRLTVSDGTSSDYVDVTVSISNSYAYPSVTGSPTIYAMRTKAYSSGYGVSGGKAAYSWATTAGTLPTGITLNATTGAITGTPTDVSYTNRNMTIRVTDSESQQASGSFTLQYVNLLTLSGSAPAGSQGQAYSFTPATSGGFGSFAYSVISGTLPAGLSLAPSTGAITGTPSGTTAGTAVTVRVTDAQGYTGDLSLNFVIVAYAPVDLSGSVSGQSTTVATYAGTKTITPNYASLNTSGGLGTITYSWARISGSTAISADAPTTKATSFSATAGPGATVSAVFRVTATDGTSSDTFDITVQLQNTYIEPTLTGTLAPRSTRTVAYSSGLTVSNGVATFAWAITSGTLPTGMSINSSTGMITGTPTDTSYTTRSITVRVTDGQGRTASSVQSIAHRDFPNMVATTTNKGWRTVAYSGSVAAVNAANTHALTYSYIAGDPITGLSIDTSTGALTGTPTSTNYGDKVYTYRATDPDGNYDQDSFTIPYQNVLSASESTPNVVAGASYSGSVSGSGGFTPYGYALQTGTLPSGITLNTGTGALTGSSASVAGYSGTFRVTDAGGRTADVAWAFSVTAALAISSSIADTTENATYSGSISASGGAPAYTFSILSGALPTGLSLNGTTGAITGTPTTPGTFNFVARVTDSVAATADSGTLQIVVANVVNVADADISNSRLVGTATAGWRIESGGGVSKLENASYTGIGTWLLTGAASDFEVRCTYTGAAPSGAVTSTWLACSTNREWYVADGTADLSPVESDMTIELRRAGGTGVVLDTAAITLYAERT